jgi:tRNA U38,U39,U40 pseudouridine synthase TruA
VDPEWETNPQKAFFQRASRTDKGVSAAKMIVSLKLLDDPDIIRKVQKSSVAVLWFV